jgi:hypothetical protein
MIIFFEKLKEIRTKKIFRLIFLSLPSIPILILSIGLVLFVYSLNVDLFTYI